MPGKPKQRECVGCGKAYRGNNRQCSTCRAMDRVCACGHTYRDTHSQCRACRAADRLCACGHAYRGTGSQCGSCRATDRVCACGKAYRGINRQCMSCQATERVCACGKAYRDTGSRCMACRATDRLCACGKAYRGTGSRCMACQATEHVCDCGKVYQGTNRQCMSCQATERVCACGHAYRGTSSQCAACRNAALPPGVLAARRRGRGNARRARKRAAEVSGPVSAEVYAAIAVSGPCVYCGGDAKHVDHIRALFRGGQECEANLVPACAPCNLSKGSRLLTEWRPDRVSHGATHSPKVAAELARLTAEAVELAEVAS